MTLQQLRYVVAIEQSGSFTAAAKKMFISQPSISAMVGELEKELGTDIFKRGRQGVILTADGKEFLKYAYQMLECETAISKRFSPGHVKLAHQFSVSSQHYTFVVNAISELEKILKNTSYNLRLKETLTSTVIEDVAKQRSEVGVIFLSDISEKYIRRLLKANYLDFAPLIEAKTSVFLHRSHPLAQRDSVTTEDLEPYPCVIYDQANDLPLYYSEEVSIPTFRPQKQLYTTDLYTSLVLMRNNGAYNIGSGILMPDISDFVAVELAGFAPITIGWIGLQNSILSDIGMEFIRLVQERLDECKVNP
ncbi:MAG TPA: LysR family transcriptional regulator [Terriglobales bacterium]|nr:LysR family transcriptional regulator [Terriglobales bacterium]